MRRRAIRGNAAATLQTTRREEEHVELLETGPTETGSVIFTDLLVAFGGKREEKINSSVEAAVS